MQRLIIRAKMPNLNDVIAASKRHWSYYSKEKKRWTEIVAQEAQAQGLYKMRLPVWVRTTYYLRTRRSDPDNVRVAIKYILDGLVQAGVLEDDSQRWIVGFQDLYDLDRDDPRIEVQLMADPREV
jgi:Holliday junction resolvase RusA-like endonuclease